MGWTSTTTGGADTTNTLPWTNDANKTGVMFLGTDLGRFAWDKRTTVTGIIDGTSQTILGSENLLAGYSGGYTGTGGSPNSTNSQPTNWACPHPNAMMFIASDKVGLGTLTYVAAGQDATGWAYSNFKGPISGTQYYEYINFGSNVSTEGGSPFASSNHSGAVNVLYCDGSVRLLQDSVDGTVYSKLITPAGSKLSTAYRQLPLGSDEF